jgi:hypothetical protein
MKKVLAITTATAALMLAGAANAAMYIVTDANGQQFVVSDDNTRTPLLMGTVEATPGNCQAGFYYQAGNNRVMSCGGGAAFMTAPVPPGTVMANGQAFPEGSLIIQSNAGAVNDTGTNKRGGNNNPPEPETTGSVPDQQGANGENTNAN